MTRVAAIDCGTNSLRLLIADIDTSAVAEGGRPIISDVDRRMVVVRLGQGIDATGEFHPDALERTRVALAEYAQLIADAGATKIRMVATSATRDAGNREDFFSMTEEILGAVVPGTRAEVISGDEEARLSFVGAVSELDPADGPFVVVDLGGGSTEVVYGTNTVEAAKSVNIGCVRLTERCLPSNPPTATEVAHARAVAREVLREAFHTVPLAPARTWVGVAGTMTTLAALAHNLKTYDPNKIHLSTTSFTRLNEVCEKLIGATRDERLALGPMHPGRADVIGGGAIITRVLADEIGAISGIDTLTVSEHDILDGIALSLVE
ncbi:Ppx/GppA family phosphatase [Hoyosella rhizosphaerae]|uniref:Exopolyphosphatase n=1 Tax=Hoyosella rhizosphaerae TaxID=1755582 RepID=A0A916UCD1_9ACTN|nr:Ppx/GppA phosphatase family protein [Hoyosella rhizosphaerae]MBN4925717.1 Ppx/GppA family phosphatase [Hoyosella rhizosphaerae]GGC68499.1 exopolyphosphatase [Hoyosella rhizosphaerae]